MSNSRLQRGNKKYHAFIHYLIAIILGKAEHIKFIVCLYIVH